MRLKNIKPEDIKLTATTEQTGEQAEIDRTTALHHQISNLKIADLVYFKVPEALCAVSMIKFVQLGKKHEHSGPRDLNTCCNDVCYRFIVLSNHDSGIPFLKKWGNFLYDEELLRMLEEDNIQLL